MQPFSLKCRCGADLPESDPERADFVLNTEVFHSKECLDTACRKDVLGRRNIPCSDAPNAAV